MRHFQFRLIPTLVTLLGAALFLRLGWWQWDKAERVEQQTQLFESRSLERVLELGQTLVKAVDVQNMPVQVRGQYEADGQFFLDNQQMQGVPGVHVITPLRIEGGDTRVWINRGWVAWGASRAVMPRVDVPTGTVLVHGRAHWPQPPKSRWTTQDPGADTLLKMRLDLPALAERAKYPVQPVLVLQDPQDASDGLVRRWPAPENKASMHRGYALQWGLITLALVVFSVVTSYRNAQAR